MIALGDCAKWFLPMEGKEMSRFKTNAEIVAEQEAAKEKQRKEAEAVKEQWLREFLAKYEPLMSSLEPRLQRLWREFYKARGLAGGKIERMKDQPGFRMIATHIKEGELVFELTFHYGVILEQPDIWRRLRLPDASDLAQELANLSMMEVKLQTEGGKGYYDSDSGGWMPPNPKEICTAKPRH